MSRRDQHAIGDQSFTSGGELVKCEHRHQGGQAHPSSRTAKSLRCTRVKVVITDGPFAETKELLGGIGRIDLRDAVAAS